MTENKSGQSSITDAVRAILAGGEKIRERVASLVTTTLKGKEFSISSLAETATNVVSSAYQVMGAQLEQVVPRDSDTTLREVVYGVGDAYGTAAQGVKQTFDAAAAHSKAFAVEDITRLQQEMAGLVSTFVASVASAGTSAVGHSAEFALQATQHANTAAEEIGPSIERAVSAVAAHPVDLTQQAARAGIEATRQVAGTLFSMLGDIMHQVASTVQPAQQPAEDASPAKDD